MHYYMLNFNKMACMNDGVCLDNSCLPAMCAGTSRGDFVIITYPAIVSIAYLDSSNSASHSFHSSCIFYQFKLTITSTKLQICDMHYLSVGRIVCLVMCSLFTFFVTGLIIL